MASTTDREICCSFCGKPQSEARRLIAGPGVYICDSCVELCKSILDDEMNLSAAGRTIRRRTPKICQNRMRSKSNWTTM